MRWVRRFETRQLMMLLLVVLGLVQVQLWLWVGMMRRVVVGKRLGTRHGLRHRRLHGWLLATVRKLGHVGVHEGWCHGWVGILTRRVHKVLLYRAVAYTVVVLVQMAVLVLCTKVQRSINKVYHKLKIG